MADAFLGTDFPFRSGKLVLVAFTTKKYYVDVGRRGMTLPVSFSGLCLFKLYK
jgi:hypothetical protein